MSKKSKNNDKEDKAKKEGKDKIEFKIITLGDSGVGKSSIIKRYVYNSFLDHTVTTIGISYSFKDVTLKDGTKISLKLIDTAGQEKYKSLSKSYYKHANCALFIFSLNDINTFNDIREWINLFEENNEGTYFVCRYLIGNKSDLEIAVEQDKIDEFRNNNKFDGYASISAKDNINIDKLFEEMSQILYDDYKKKGKADQKNMLLKKHEKPKKSCLACLIEHS